MTTYLTVEYAPGYGISLHTARRLTDDEKQSYLPEYQDYRLVGTGNDVDLNNITWISLYEFLGKRAPDGEFAGCNNRAYIITQEQWDALIAMNNGVAVNKAEQERSAEIAELKQAKAHAEKQMVNGELPGKEEAREKAKRYNDVHNEGGYGYVPHYYYDEEYKRICARLDELKGAI